MPEERAAPSPGHMSHAIDLGKGGVVCHEVGGAVLGVGGTLCAAASGVCGILCGVAGAWLLANLLWLDPGLLGSAWWHGSRAMAAAILPSASSRSLRVSSSSSSSSCAALDFALACVFALAAPLWLGFRFCRLASS